MSDTRLIALAAAPLPAVVDHVHDDQLGDPTPCTDFDVRALVNHLLFWAPSIVGAAGKTVVAPPAESEADVDLTGDEWRATLRSSVDRTVEAWSEPAAWDGMTYMGNPMELPAPMIAGMTMVEMVVHGWDLARATGQSPRWDDMMLAYLLNEVQNTAEQGRQIGAYGPAVHVSDSSATLDRVLGLTGRDPAWRS